MKDYYKILGVDSNVDAQTLKKAFRALAKKYHPDTSNGDKHTQEMFEEINEAYSVLSDDAKRKDYDNERARRGKQSADSQSSDSKQKSSHQYSQNPFAGFTSGKFKMDFGDMMFDELNKEKEKKNNKKPDMADVSNQFASFFGFRPK